MAVVMEAVVPVKVRVGFGVPVLVGDVVKEQHRRRLVLGAVDVWSTSGLTRAQAALVRAGWRLEVARLRGVGELLDTRDSLVAFGVRLELRARGWDHDEWPPLPEEAMGPGRQPGSREVGFPEELRLRLPVELVHRARAGCWFTSVEAIRALQAWRDEHPYVVRTSPGCDDPLAEYERQAAKVTTTGVIWRAGVTRGLAHAVAMPALDRPEA